MKTHLNLLTIKYQRGQVIRHRLRQWCAVWSIAILLLLINGGLQWRLFCYGRDRLASLERDYAPVKHAERDMQRNRQELGELRRRESLALEVSQRRPLLTLIGHISRAARETNGKVSVRHLNLAPSSNASKDSNPPSRLLMLQGVGEDNLSIAQFTAALRSAGVFDEVQLKSTGEVTVGKTVARSYNVECTF